MLDESDPDAPFWFGHGTKYKFYLRTPTSTGDIAHSYLVDAFEPIREVRESATGETPMTDEQVEKIKQRSGGMQDE